MCLNLHFSRHFSISKMFCFFNFNEVVRRLWPEIIYSATKCKIVESWPQTMSIFVVMKNEMFCVVVKLQFITNFHEYLPCFCYHIAVGACWLLITSYLTSPALLAFSRLSSQLIKFSVVFIILNMMSLFCKKFEATWRKKLEPWISYKMNIKDESYFRIFPN